MAKTTEEQLLSELRAIKMLLVLKLMNDGVRQRAIAATLGVSEATVSRMIPKGTKAAPKKEGDTAE